MAEITAVMVKNLRERSGLPMMDCKKALMATGGDEEAAMELLRKSGAAAAEKKAGRATSEGRIGAHVDTAKKAGALVELNCETAPVANNPEFKALAKKLGLPLVYEDPKGFEKFLKGMEETLVPALKSVNLYKPM